MTYIFKWRLVHNVSIKLVKTLCKRAYHLFRSLNNLFHFVTIEQLGRLVFNIQPIHFHVHASMPFSSTYQSKPECDGFDEKSRFQILFSCCILLCSPANPVHHPFIGILARTNDKNAKQPAVPTVEVRTAFWGVSNTDWGLGWKGGNGKGILANAGDELKFLSQRGGKSRRN